jgi:hypothetical protein
MAGRIRSIEPDVLTEPRIAKRTDAAPRPRERPRRAPPRLERSVSRGAARWPAG